MNNKKIKNRKEAVTVSHRTTTNNQVATCVLGDTGESGHRAGMSLHPVRWVFFVTDCVVVFAEESGAVPGPFVPTALWVGEPAGGGRKPVLLSAEASSTFIKSHTTQTPLTSGLWV